MCTCGGVCGGGVHMCVCVCVCMRVSEDANPKILLCRKKSSCRMIWPISVHVVVAVIFYEMLHLLPEPCHYHETHAYVHEV